MNWDIPENATSPRGWLFDETLCVGFFLDYGAEHYRSGDASPEHAYCSERQPCRTCQPGNVLAVRYPAGPGTDTTSRYCETISEARAFVRTGRFDDYGHALAASIADLKHAGRIPAHV